MLSDKHVYYICVGESGKCFENVVCLTDEVFTRYIVLCSLLSNVLLEALLTLTLGLTSLTVEAERLALCCCFSLFFICALGLISVVTDMRMSNDVCCVAFCQQH